MSKIPLAIDKNYCASWDVFCGIRELLQNAKDADDNGHRMTVEHFPRTARLEITSANVHIDPARLLILGKSDKTPGQQRGQFGEGFVLGTLALVRKGHEVKFTNGNLSWQVAFEAADAGHPFEGSELLTFKSRKVVVTEQDFKVVIDGISAEAWRILRKLFLFLDAPQPDDTFALSTGTLLLEPARQGQVFSRGIFVRTYENLACGYDMNNLELDRDRNALNEWDLQYKLGALWQEACAKRPDLAAPRIYVMAKNNAAEMRNLKHHADERLLQRVRECFTREHGEDAAPVTDMAAAQVVTQAGATPVVVSNTLEELLVKSGLSAVTVATRFAGTVEGMYSPKDLTDAENAMLTRLAPFAPVLAVVSFRGNQNICRLINDNTTVGVERRLLAGSFRALLASTLIAVSQQKAIPPLDILLNHIAGPLDATPPATVNENDVTSTAAQLSTLYKDIHDATDDIAF